MKRIIAGRWWLGNEPQQGRGCGLHGEEVRNPRLPVENYSNGDREKSETRCIIGCNLAGVPLFRTCIVDLVEVFVIKLSQSRKNEIVRGRSIKDWQPSMDWVRYFLQLHTERFDNVHRQVLEYARHRAMNPGTVAVHFARLIMAYKKFGITDPTFLYLTWTTLVLILRS